MHNKKIIGKIGEDMACEYLYQEGYEILERNFRCRLGEIDIIATKNNKKAEKKLIFVEVKTRTNLNYGRPSEAINNIKKQHILKVAKYYILKNKIKNPIVRFDAIEVLLGKQKTCSINHIKQAF